MPGLTVFSNLVFRPDRVSFR